MTHLERGPRRTLRLLGDWNHRVPGNRWQDAGLNGAAFDLAQVVPCSPDARRLKDLHVARAGLVKDRTNLCNRAKVQEIAVLKRQTKARLARLERQIAELDAE